MKFIPTFLVFSLTAAVFAEKQSFDRYQSIIDRQPFGQPPAGFDPQKMASEVSRTDGAAAEEQLTMEQEQIQKAVSFSVMNVEADGSVMVGFADRSDPKAPKHYYLAVGETQDGWFVKACDPSEETLTIVKDEVEATLKLGDNSNPAQKTGRGARPMTLQASPASVPARSTLLGRRFGATAEQPSSYRGRRARREMEEAQAKAAAEAREQERKRQAEEAAAREAAEKEKREHERAEQRQQLMAIQEELRKAREEKERRNAEQEAERQMDERLSVE